MTNQSKINALFTAIACVIDMKLDKDNLVEFEFVASLKELSNDPMFDSLKQEGFDKNLFGISTGGNLFPTIKGFDVLFGQPSTKIVTKLQPKSVSKLTDSEVIDTFVEVGAELCNRIPKGTMMQRKVFKNYNSIYETAVCVANGCTEFVGSLAVVEPVVEVEETVVEKPKTRKKKEKETIA
jgi:hypothetical protein